MAFIFGNQPTLGGQLGQAFGTGLEALARQKLEQVALRNQQNQLSKAFEDLLPQESKGMASALAQLPEKDRQIALKDILASPGQQAYAQAILGNQQGISTLPGVQQQTTPRLTEKQATEIAKIRQQERQFTSKLQAAEQKEIAKETLPYYKEISDQAKGAKANDIRLDRMEQLINAGKLSSPITQALIDTAAKGIFGIGIDLSGLQNADTQEFNKLSKDFLKEAKPFFGSRLTDNDLKAFLQTVPTLLQSDEGKMRVISNLKLFNEAAKIRKQAADKIITENEGRRPRNLDSLVEDRISSDLDNIAERFKRGAEINKPDLAKEYQERISPIGYLSRAAKSIGL